MSMREVNIKDLMGKKSFLNTLEQLNFVTGKVCLCVGHVYKERKENVTHFIIMDIKTKKEVPIEKENLQFLLFDAERAKNCQILNVDVVNCKDDYKYLRTRDAYKALQKFKEQLD